MLWNEIKEGSDDDCASYKIVDDSSMEMCIQVVDHKVITIVSIFQLTYNALIMLEESPKTSGKSENMRIRYT